MGEASTIFECTIPVPYHAVKKNSRPVFNGKLCTNPRTKKAERFFLPALQRAKLDNGIHDPIGIELRAVLTFFYSAADFYTRDTKTKQLRRKWTVADTLGLGEFIQDSLQHQTVGIIVCGERTEVKIQLWPIHVDPLQLSL
jgi:hypothetical protein